MALDPRLRPIVALVNAAGADDLSLPMEARRERSAALARRAGPLVMRKEAEPKSTTHVQVPVEGGRIRVRIYTPHGIGPFPLYVFIHGGGWCEGTLDERDPRCRSISAGARCVVASVDYRLAPENAFPTAPEDCYATLLWLVEHAEQLGVDAARVAVGGESAGGNLAAVLCLMARDRHGPRICHQWLDVPAVDLTMSQSGFAEVPDGNLLDQAAMDDYRDQYLLDPSSITDPLCSPLLAPSLADLPPAWIVTAELDKLRGDGEAYAAALNAAGVKATHTRLAGHIHPSFAFTRILPSARENQAAGIVALRTAFAGA